MSFLQSTLDGLRELLFLRETELEEALRLLRFEFDATKETPEEHVDRYLREKRAFLRKIEESGR